MNLDIITEEEQLVIRRMNLAPGEAMYWHTDACRRFSVVVSGDQLSIEYLHPAKDAPEQLTFEVQPGECGWDEPEDRIHRAVNVGSVDYTEIVTFYRDNATIEPQPRHSG